MFFNVSATVLTGGVAGLELLKSTRERQEDIVRNNTLVQRETEYFQENIGNVTSAEELVDDPRLLRVALEAYGLGEEFSKTAYIQNILESDLSDETSAANRVSDPRWTAFAQAFLKSEVTVPGPLNSDFGAKMSQRAYAVELSNYTTQSKIDSINEDAESFRTAMADITTATQFVNNRDALNFVKEAFGLSDSTATNEEIAGYLNAFNEYSLNEDGSDVVPDEWKDVRSTLSFFNETYIQDTTVTTDKKPNDPDTIEGVVLQRFRHELSVETGHYDYTKRQETFTETMRTYDNVDDFLADETSLSFIKEAYNLEYDITDTATIKEYLVGTFRSDIPAKWQNVREALGFNTANITPSTEDMTAFESNMASYNTVDDFLNNADAVHIVKTVFNLEDDTTNNATLKTYLTAADDSSVPDAFKNMRLALGYYTEDNVGQPTTAEEQTNIDNFDTTLNAASDFEDLMADSDFVNFIKTSYGLEGDTATNEEIATYLTAADESGVPAAWQNVRTDLSFFNYTDSQDPLPADLQQKRDDFETILSTATNINDLTGDANFKEVLKTAYGLEASTATDKDIKNYLLDSDPANVPAEWQQVRADLGLFEGNSGNNITPPDSATITAIGDSYESIVASYSKIVTPPAQTTIDTIKSNYEEAVRTYNIETTAPDTSDIEALRDIYLIETGTRDNLEETIGFSALKDLTERHEEFNISYLDDISKFNRFEKEADNFELSIGLAASDSDIAADGRALRFALTAFGLENESYDSFKAFNILTGEEPLGQSASDAKWRDFRNNFSFSAAANTLKTGEEDFSAAIIDDFVESTFIEAVGEQDQDLRLALYFDKRVKELAGTDGIDDFGWLQVAGETPLATVFQTAFSLPSSFGSLDLDKQQEIYGLRSQSVIGTPNLSDYTNQNFVDQLIQTYLLRATISAASSGTTASTLLSNSGASGSLF